MNQWSTFYNFYEPQLPCHNRGQINKGSISTCVLKGLGFRVK